MDASQLPEGVTLYYTDKAVHLTTNDALMTFLRQKGNGSLPLSRTILAGYEAECGAALQLAAARAVAVFAIPAASNSSKCVVALS